jgi:hypothetical protein
LTHPHHPKTSCGPPWRASTVITRLGSPEASSLFVTRSRLATMPLGERVGLAEQGGTGIAQPAEDHSRLLEGQIHLATFAQGFLNISELSQRARSSISTSTA